MGTMKHWALAAFAASALALAGCGGGGSTATVTPTPDPALIAAQGAAEAAATAAATAADAAEAAVTAQTDNMAADAASYALAQDAAKRARDASDAAQAASTAAAATTDTAEAQDQQDAAENAQEEAEAEQANAETNAMMVADAQKVLDDAAAEATALAEARSAADTAAKAARQAANDAQAAADEAAELVGADNKVAMDAQTAADAADEAADAAEAANASAKSAATSDVAEGHQDTAETQQGEAEDQLAAAQELQREAQLAHDHSDQQKKDQLADDLKEQRDLATAARDAAKTAADNAATAADDADDARMDAVGLQTNEASSGHAETARDHAEKAMAAYMTAKTASETADAAETVAAATEARIDAEDAQEAAEGHEAMAAESKSSAEEAAGMELMVMADGMAYSVGDSEAMSNAAYRLVTENGQTIITGTMESMKIETSGDAVTGVEYADNPGGEATPSDVTDDRAYQQAVEQRPTLPIGKTIDSSDDNARLVLVDHYAGSRMVDVFSLGTDTSLTGTKAGYVTIQNTNLAGTETDNVSLRYEGEFYQAGETDGSLTYTDEVAATAKGREVFSYVNPNTNVVHYVVEASVNTDSGSGVTTWAYATVDVTAVAAPDGDDTGTDNDEVRVQAALPEEAAYKHINFGVWAALGTAAKSGVQSLDSLGIGFVQSIGDGMTGGDMPNNGDAEYEGNWVAAVQRADRNGDGAVNLQDGTASLIADFGKGDITATLTGLAVLKGDISGNTFSGEKATVGNNTHGLTSGADFTGSFSGGFYGAKAAEAGGIFDYTSEDMKAGAFRGAFGADRQ